MSIRLLHVTALALLAASTAQAQGGMRFSISRSVSGNNSDNTGFNVGSSGVAGNTFGPQNPNAGSGSNAPIGAVPGSVSANVTGGNVSATGLSNGVNVTSALGVATAQLGQGVVSVATAGGGTVTVTISPQVGQILLRSIDPQSSATRQSSDAARTSVILAMESDGVNPASAAAVGNAMLEISQMQTVARAPGADHGTSQGNSPTRNDARTPPGDGAGQTTAPAQAPIQAPPMAAPSAATLDAAGTSAVRAAALHATNSMNQMSYAISTFMAEQPNIPLPAPMLAAALVVRSAAGGVATPSNTP